MKLGGSMRMLTSIVVLVGSGDLHAQGGVGGNCNNLTRSKAIEAGPTPNQITANCTSLSVSVGGATFSTPASCLVAYTVYLESVWTCGPQASGLHCNPNASEATHRDYLDGGCPSTAGLNNGDSWASWEDVSETLAAVIRALTSCIPPRVTEEIDLSAKTTSCVTGGGGGGGGSGATSLPSALERLRSESLSQEPYNPFLDGGSVRVGTSTPRSAVLAAALDAAQRLDGAEFEALLEVSHFEAGSTDPVSTRRVSRTGCISEGGLFDWKDVSIAGHDAESKLITRRYMFDGRLLASVLQGAQEGNVYTADYAKSSPVWKLDILPMARPVHEWLTNPYGMTRSSAHEFDSESMDSGVLLRKRAVAGGQPYCDKTIAIDTLSFPVPVIRETVVLDPQGLALELRSFDNFQEIAPEVWRPLKVVLEYRLDRQELGRRVVVSMEIWKARPLTAVESSSLWIPEVVEPRIWNAWE